jgi:hypothetical protein
MSTKSFTGELGVPLSRKAVRVLKDAGIYALPQVTVEHQHLAKRYVVRGIESGGAVREFGRYVTFLGENGERVPYLQPVEAIGGNGLHAIVIAPVLLRVDMLRKGRTYEAVITRHALAETHNGARPGLGTELLFRGFHGRLELDLAGKDKAQAGSMLPTFLSLAGEPIPIPKKFTSVLKAVTRAVWCLSCTHSHYLIPPRAAAATAVGTRPVEAAASAGVDGIRGGMGDERAETAVQVRTAAS